MNFLVDNALSPDVATEYLTIHTDVYAAELQSTDE